MAKNDLDIILHIKRYSDALHLACAEESKADVLLTTDRRFINVVAKLATNMRVINPLIWISEVLYE